MLSVGQLSSKYKILYITSYFYLITLRYYFLCKVTLLITLLQSQWGEILSGLMKALSKKNKKTTQVITAGGRLSLQQWLFSTRKMNYSNNHRLGSSWIYLWIYHCGWIQSKSLTRSFPEIHYLVFGIPNHLWCRIYIILVPSYKIRRIFLFLFTTLRPQMTRLSDNTFLDS